MIKGAIFDVDGTLFNSMFIWDTIGEVYLRSIGYEPLENLNKTFKSMSLHQAACYYKSEYGVTLSVEEIIDGVNEMIEHYYRDVVELKLGVAEFLQALKEHNVKMCIATATDKHLVEMALSRTGIGEFFSEIFTCASVGHGKDKPVIFMEALRHLDTNKQDTVIFEDALYAIKTATQAGFQVVGIYDMSEEHQDEVKALTSLYLPDFRNFEAFRNYTLKL